MKEAQPHWQVGIIDLGIILAVVVGLCMNWLTWPGGPGERFMKWLLEGK